MSCVYNVRKYLVDAMLSACYPNDMRGLLKTKQTLFNNNYMLKIQGDYVCELITCDFRNIMDENL